jgi:hypothetical protein
MCKSLYFGYFLKACSCPEPQNVLLLSIELYHSAFYSETEREREREREKTGKFELCRMKLTNWKLR